MLKDLKAGYTLGHADVSILQDMATELQRLVTVFSGDGGSLYTTQTKREAIAKAKEVIAKCGKRSKVTNRISTVRQIGQCITSNV